MKSLPFRVVSMLCLSYLSCAQVWLGDQLYANTEPHSDATATNSDGNGNTTIVHDNNALRQSLGSLKPHTTLKIAPGEFTGGHYVNGVDNITIEALDPKMPPHFVGGAYAFHFSRCPNLHLRHLRISGQSGNGLNLDDGGKFDQPVRGVQIEDVQVSDIGPKGNRDGIKCSGIEHLTIRNCSLQGWGGQGIDMVGCHNGLITGCRFVGKDGYTATAAVQTKGGSSNIVIEECTFFNAGERPLNIGGSTDLKLFRPTGALVEAKNITVKNCTIEGSSCAVAFVGVDGAEFSGNTILYPERWIFRILQETNTEGFPPCRNVVVLNNKIVFRRSQVKTEINVGGGTAPTSFRFERNKWFAEDKPNQSKPQLPIQEISGIYGEDPR